jgi:hypothetical protein
MAHTFSPTELFGTLEIYQCKEVTAAHKHTSLCMNFSLRSSYMDIFLCVTQKIPTVLMFEYFDMQ